MKDFLDQFKFDPSKSGFVGVEREAFLLDGSGKIAPLAEKVLKRLGISDRFGYELSACQLEDRIGPCHIGEVKQSLLDNEAVIKQAEKALGFSRLYQEVAPDDMPLDVYPDPTGRYQAIVEKMPHHVLLAACQVIGTHIHIGMPDHQTALRVYNQVIPYHKELCCLGDNSKGRRLEVYRVVAPDFEPPHYNSWQDFYDEALACGFVHSPRNCWHIIRLSVHGTIEFRTFGASPSLHTIMSWVKYCHYLCHKAMG